MKKVLAFLPAFCHSVFANGVKGNNAKNLLKENGDEKMVTFPEFFGLACAFLGIILTSFAAYAAYIARKGN